MPHPWHDILKHGKGPPGSTPAGLSYWLAQFADCDSLTNSRRAGRRTGVKINHGLFAPRQTARSHSRPRPAALKFNSPSSLSALRVLDQIRSVERKLAVLFDGPRNRKPQCNAPWPRRLPTGPRGKAANNRYRPFDNEVDLAVSRVLFPSCISGRIAKSVLPAVRVWHDAAGNRN